MKRHTIHWKLKSDTFPLVNKCSNPHISTITLLAGIHGRGIMLREGKEKVKSIAVTQLLILQLCSLQTVPAVNHFVATASFFNIIQKLFLRGFSYEQKFMHSLACFPFPSPFHPCAEIFGISVLKYLILGVFSLQQIAVFLHTVC